MAKDWQNLAKNARKSYKSDPLKIKHRKKKIQDEEEDDSETPFVDKLLVFYQKYTNETDLKSRISFENMLLRKTIEELNANKK